MANLDRRCPLWYTLSMDKNSPIIEKQWEHCHAQEAVDGDGHITVWALGSFVPDDEEQARLFLQVSKPYKGSFGPPGSNPKMTSIIRQENEFRMSLVIKMNAFLDILRSTGCSVRRAVKTSGLGRMQSESLRTRVPAFHELWTEAFEEVTDKLEEEGLRRAIDGVDEPVWYQGMEVGSKRVYSDSLLSMMLQGRRPEIYKQRVAQEMSGPGGGPIEMQNMTDEQLDSFIKTKLAECQLNGLIPKGDE